LNQQVLDGARDTVPSDEGTGDAVQPVDRGAVDRVIRLAMFSIDGDSSIAGSLLDKSEITDASYVALLRAFGAMIAEIADLARESLQEGESLSRGLMHLSGLLAGPFGEALNLGVAVTGLDRGDVLRAVVRRLFEAPANGSR
jgi:hypothetical protein